MNNGLSWFKKSIWVENNSQNIWHKFWIWISKKKQIQLASDDWEMCKARKVPINVKLISTSTACILISKREKKKTNHSQIIRLSSIKIDQNVEEIWAKKKKHKHTCSPLVMIQKVNYPVQITAKCEKYPFFLLSFSVPCIGWHKQTKSHDIDDIQQKLNQNPGITMMMIRHLIMKQKMLIIQSNCPKYTHAMHSRWQLCAIC